jgi:NAD(P)-dependent dehydrogenase (short-subunit alcohol dehydrogenase family)
MAGTGRAPRFEGKVAIVAGATANPSIGRSTARMLAEEGAQVVISGRDGDRLAAAERELKDAGFDVLGFHGSLEDDEVPGQLVDAAVARYGRLDLICNTVGGSRGSTTPMTITKEALLGTIELNIWGGLALVQHAMQNGLADGGGSVVFISSGTVNKTTPMMISYAAGKSALNQMTRTLARDLGPQGVRVNGVAPGFTKTTATLPMFGTGDMEQSNASALPLRRSTVADDIAHCVVFLLSEEARQITGQTIDVDGGNHLMSGFSPIPQQGSGG